MAKSKHKNVKFTAEERAYDLPAELDITHLRRVGSGKKTVERLVERSKRTVGLDPDVASVFKDSEAVNAVLRAIIKNVPAMQTTGE